MSVWNPRKAYVVYSIQHKARIEKIENGRIPEAEHPERNGMEGEHPQL